MRKHRSVKIKRSGKTYSRPASAWLSLLFGVMFFVIGGLPVWFIGIRPLCKIMQSAYWVEVPAIVVKSELLKSGSNRSIGIFYDYEYMKGKYTGNRYDFYCSFDIYSDDNIEYMLETIRQYPEGRKINCLVNPENPAEAVISRKIYYPDLLPCALGLLFPLIGLFVIIISIKEMLKSERKTFSNPAEVDGLPEYTLSPQINKQLKWRYFWCILPVAAWGIIGFMSSSALLIVISFAVMAYCIFKVAVQRNLCPQCGKKLEYTVIAYRDGSTYTYYCPGCKIKSKPVFHEKNSD